MFQHLALPLPQNGDTEEQLGAGAFIPMGQLQAPGPFTVSVAIMPGAENATPPSSKEKPICPTGVDEGQVRNLAFYFCLAGTRKGMVLFPCWSNVRKTQL